MNNIYKYTLILATLSSCSTYKAPMSLNEKMNYYQPKSDSIVNVYNIPIDEKLIVHSSRFPASTAHLTKKKPLKNIYFTALYSQYSRLSHVSGIKSPKINSCPNYHNEYLKLKKDTKNTNQYFSWDRFEKDLEKQVEQKITYSPSLYLPLTHNSTMPRVLDYIKSKKPLNISKSYKIHLTKIYRELSELCEVGSSTNSYNFQNIYATFVSDKSYFKSNKENLRRFINVPIFTNETLIKSFEKYQHKNSRFPASLTTKTDSSASMKYIYQKLNLTWLSNYIEKKYR